MLALKNALPALALAPLLFLAPPADACVGDGAAKTAKAGAKKASYPLVHTATLNVDGMTCGSCSKGLTAALQKQPGVVEAKVVLKDKKAIVTFDPAATTTEKLVGVMLAEGDYKAELVKDGLVAHAHLYVTGAATAATGVLQKQPGVTHVSVTNKDKRTHVEFDPAKTKTDTLVAALAKAGLKAELKAPAKS